MVKLIFCSGVKRKEIVRSGEKNECFETIAVKKRTGKINENLVLGLEYRYCLPDYVVPKHL